MSKFKKKKDLIFEILRAYYHRQNKKIRIQTNIVYSNKIIKVYEILNIDDITTTDIFLDFEKMKTILEENFENLNSRCTYLSSLLVWMQALQVHKDFVKKYQELLFEYSKSKNKKQKIKIQNEILKVEKNKIEQIKNYHDSVFEIKYNKLIPKYEGVETIYKKVDKMWLQKYLIFNLYNGKHIAPVRCDYNRMKIIKEYKEELSKDFNYYDGEKFIFRNYKTSGKYGSVEVECPEGLRDLIDKIHPATSTAGSDFMFINPNNYKPYTDNAFGKLVKKTFDGYTICDLRKFYLTERFKELHEVLRNLKESSRCMMNSPDVCLKSYIYEEMNKL